ncbi:MAG: HTTM domain-containing protein [Bradymonadia bacterium]
MSLTRALNHPVDGASLAMFRVAFGVLMCASALRFLFYDWVTQFYVTPTFNFSWLPGLRPLPGWGMYGVFWALAGLAVLIAVGLYTRLAAAAFFCLFTYVQLLEKANYLNHYYLIVLVSALMIWLPTERAFSLDARWRNTGGQVPAGTVWAVRGQLTVVYFFAGLAKVQSDWLFEAQPLRIWLAGHQDFPILGPLMTEPVTAYVFSWAGMIFDLTIPFWLMWRRSRPFAYLVVLAFHLMTWGLFQIGLFPWMMMAFTPIFFGYSWPRRWCGGQPSTRAPQPIRPLATWALVLYGMAQVIMPLRHHLYPGNHLWTEEGFRLSWHVMVMEKSGAIDFWAEREGKRSQIDLREHLTPVQIRMMSTQPDMILDFAHHLAEQLPPGTRLTVDGYVSLNGRRSQRLLDPEVDIAPIEDVTKLRPWLQPLEDDRVSR